MNEPPSELMQRIAAWNWLALLALIVCGIVLYLTNSDLPNY